MDLFSLYIYALFTAMAVGTALAGSGITLSFMRKKPILSMVFIIVGNAMFIVGGRFAIGKSGIIPFIYVLSAITLIFIVRNIIIIVKKRKTLRKPGEHK